MHKLRAGEGCEWMIHWAEATVKRVLSSRPNVQELEVRTEHGDISSAVHYTDVLPSLQPGDHVLLNTTAVELHLGSGGMHFVHSILNTSSKQMTLPEGSTAGHIMKLRYTPFQRKVLTVEEPDSPYHSLFQEEHSLEGMPVLIGELHSMLPIAVNWLRYLNAQQHQTHRLKLSYIMSEGGALPIQYSHHVRELSVNQGLDGTVTYGHAYGGDLESINKYTALIAAQKIQQADVTIITMGPGIVGTGTLLGHSGLETIELIHAAENLGGKPIIIPRISFSDTRERHFGLSHHLLYSLSKLTHFSITLPIPHDLTDSQLGRLEQQLKQYNILNKHHILPIKGIDSAKIAESMKHYRLPIRTMGRGLPEDSAFFLGVCAAAQAVWELLAHKEFAAREITAVKD
jgi:hypothetical protein